MDNLIFSLLFFSFFSVLVGLFGRHIERKHLNELLEKSNNLPISELIPIVLPQATSWVILLAVMWLFRMTTLNMCWPPLKIF